MAKRLLVFGFGLAAYAAFLASVLYGIGFIGNLYVAKTVDTGVNANPATGLAVDLALIVLFGFQHSVMARRGFKRWIVQRMPEALERSIFVAGASLCLFLLFWLWRPFGQPIWTIPAGPIRDIVLVLYGLGWLIVVLSTFQLGHFDFAGLRQAWCYLVGRPYTPVEFKQPLLYRIVRHPLMLGLLISFWASPRMSVGHLLFSAGMTLYILIGLAFEEKDLVRDFGDSYRRYRNQVPMLLPRPGRRKAGSRQHAAAAAEARD